jgi:hypothetical protein
LRDAFKAFVMAAGTGRYFVMPAGARQMREELRIVWCCFAYDNVHSV